MEIVIISIAAFLVAILTFFSGFGLGTILTPVFMIFFPVELAIALTGVVHFINNIFKLILVGRKADKAVLIRFGIPAVIAAAIGAWLLLFIPDVNPLISYDAFGRSFEILPAKFTISVILLLFALMDLFPIFNKMQFGREKLPIGGFLSGFFGGLSGNQGALRSAFLIKAGLSKEAFIGTAVVVSTFVDLTRLGIYSTRFVSSGLSESVTLIVCATVAALSGTLLGKRLLKKITLKSVHLIVAIMLIVISIALGMGII